MKKKNHLIFLIRLVVSWLLGASALAQSKSILLPLELDYTAPTSYLIEDIHVTGAKSLDAKAIVAISGLQPGDIVKIPGPAMTDAIQRLWKHKLIKDVAIYGCKVIDDRVVLTIDITECPRLLDYSFEGIKKKEIEQLKDKIAFAKGRIITDELIKNAQKAIQGHWVQAGYWHATVTITSLPDHTHPNHVRLKIKVNKGEKINVNVIHFTGNKHIASNVLRCQMKHIREKPRFTLVKDLLKQVFTLQPISKGGVLRRPFKLKEGWHYLQDHVILFYAKFNQTNLAEDKKRIISYYQTQGFSDAAIEDTVFKQADGLLNVWMKIEEGTQYRVGDIRWVGNHLYDDNTLNHILNIKKGDLYNPLLLQQRLYNNPEGQDVASLYVDRGYLSFQANAIEVGLEENIVNLEIRIQEGSQTFINKVLIEGNKLTQDHVIRREIRTLPGDKLSRANVYRSQRELAQLSIFDLAIGILPMPNLVDNTVDIKYTVKERLQFEFKISGGMGNGKVIGAGIFSINNFSLGNLWKSRSPLGGGQILGIKFEKDRKTYQNFHFQFTDPWLGGKKPRYFHLSFNRASEENGTSIGGNAILGTRLSWPDDYMLLKVGFDYHRHYYKDYDLLGNQKKLTGNLDDLSVNLSLERDSTGPSPIYPKEGSKLSLNVRVTPPWSYFSGSNQNAENSAVGEYPWKEYHQWMLDGSYFLKLLDDLVLNVRGHFGVLGKFPAQRNIGPFERFSLGGMMPPESIGIRGREHISLRGYAEDYIVPKDPVNGYLGGVIYDKFVLELRYPIIFHYLASSYILAFAEGGNTWTNYQKFEPFSLNRSVGVGLRFYFPFLIGTTIGFDWGYGFDKRLADKGNNKLDFHFSMGTGLR